MVVVIFTCIKWFANEWHNVEIFFVMGVMGYKWLPSLQIFLLADIVFWLAFLQIIMQKYLQFGK